VFSAFYNQVPYILPKPELLSVSSSAARRRPRPVLCAALLLCAPLRPAPRVVLLFLPPPALPALATPRSSTSGRCPERLPCRSARPAGATCCLCWLGDLPLPFLLSRRSCLATKLDRASSPQRFSPPFPPRH
jgi:hypothetical protein